MSNITVCPHYLINYTNSTPKEIEKNIIFPLYKIIKKCIEEKINIIMSSDILKMFQNSYPWNLVSDPSWKGYILTWHLLITQNIINRCEILNVENNIKCEDKACSVISKNVNDLFVSFLNLFLTKKMPNNMSDEGVITSSLCGSGLQSYGCCLIKTENDVEKVKYPWLRVYNKPLPPAGEYPFVPPSSWRKHSHPKRGINHGFLDNNGNEWQWDRFHKNDHWDVQDGTPYKNVSTTGKIL